MTKTTTTIALFSILAAACSVSDEAGDTGEEAGDAEAALEPVGGAELTGEADFGPEGEGILAEVEVEEATPGDYPVEIHALGDCGDDGLASGDVWSPDGDLGVMTVTGDGLGIITLMSTAWTLGDGGATDLLGKSVVILAGPDDATPIACGVIAPDMD